MCKNCRLILMLVLTGGFFLVELVTGYMSKSIALISDSFSMLSDVISLSIALAAAYVSKLQKRAGVLGALLNAVILCALTFGIFTQAMSRLLELSKLEDVVLVLIVGALGLGVNVVGLILFQDCCSKRGRCMRAGSLGNDTRDQSGNRNTNVSNLNIQGVFLQLLGDALGSVVVVVTATIFYVFPLGSDDPCNWECYVDPSLTIVMVMIIYISVYPLLKETVHILLENEPKELNVQDMGKLMLIM
ncbi:zinc transporter 10 [Amblyraja radiata]|uniref:zinc transporter 10 n=1 Tax=Amblyraja radiata TaxID=386614 RepID=UPI0014042663|nr:zinc transporter 10 [Amblyraja radiata]